jgi:hypothetical protein
VLAPLLSCEPVVAARAADAIGLVLVQPTGLVGALPRLTARAFGLSVGNVLGVAYGAVRATRFEAGTRNDLTFALEPLGDVPPERLFVTADRYGYDVEELVQWIGTRGAFIHPDTGKPLSGADVRRLLKHPSDATRALTAPDATEPSEGTLRPETVALLVRVVCVIGRDYSVGFPAAQAVVGEYWRAWRGLPPCERDLLEVTHIASLMQSATGGVCLRACASALCDTLLRLHVDGTVQLSARQRADLKRCDRRIHQFNHGD